MVWIQQLLHIIRKRVRNWCLLPVPFCCNYTAKPEGPVQLTVLDYVGQAIFYVAFTAPKDNLLQLINIRYVFFYLNSTHVLIFLRVVCMSFVSELTYCLRSGSLVVIRKRYCLCVTANILLQRKSLRYGRSGCGVVICIAMIVISIISEMPKQTLWLSNNKTWTENRR